MSVSYFKRYRMEIDLHGRSFECESLPPKYRLIAWSPNLLAEHAEAKFHSFRQEIDAEVFACLGVFDGCYRLMQEISLKDGFLPLSTWLLAFVHGSEIEYCGTIQGIRVNQVYGAIQNVGVIPDHRGRGLGRRLVSTALRGFQQAGLARGYLEVTAQNHRAVSLYERMGFRRTKTIYKAVELAYS